MVYYKIDFMVAKKSIKNEVLDEQATADIADAVAELETHVKEADAKKTSLKELEESEDKVQVKKEEVEKPEHTVAGKKSKSIHHVPDWIKFGFPPPEYLRFNFVGINLSDHSVKVCKSAIDNDNYIIEVIDSITLPPNSVVDGEIKDPEAVIKVFKKIKDTYKIDFVRLSVPEELVYLASFSIPPTDKDKLRSVVEFHIGDYIPLSVDEIQFDYDIIAFNEAGKVTELVATAIAKTHVAGLLSLLSEAKLYPLSLEVEAQAIARVVVPKHAEVARTYLVLDLGRSRTGISIIKNGMVRYTTTVSFGGDKLVSKIAELRSIDPVEAEELKQPVGMNLSQYGPEEVKEIKATVGQIVSEIERRAIFWVSQAGEPIDEVLLVGGNALTPGLTDYLETETKIPVNVPDIWTNVFEADSKERPVSKNESLGFAAVIGLAINEEK